MSMRYLDTRPRQPSRPVMINESSPDTPISDPLRADALSQLFGPADEVNGAPTATDIQQAAQRVALDGESPGNGLAHLVLTLIKLLHDLLEKQAIRRMESGSLTEEEVERVGRTLMCQVQELEDLCEQFGFEYDDLGLNLGTIHVS